MSEKLKFDMDKILTGSIREGQKSAAKVMHELYEDFCEAGFTADQALELIKATIANAKGKNNDR